MRKCVIAFNLIELLPLRRNNSRGEYEKVNTDILRDKDITDNNDTIKKDGRSPFDN